MSTQRKHASAECKARGALEALKGLKTVHELARPSGVHPPPMAHWNPRLQKELPEIFSARRAKHEPDQEAFHAQRAQHIGQRQVEGDWGKNKLDVFPEDTRALRKPAHPQSSLARQGDLVGLPRATSN